MGSFFEDKQRRWSWRLLDVVDNSRGENIMVLIILSAQQYKTVAAGPLSMEIALKSDIYQHQYSIVIYRPLTPAGTNVISLWLACTY